MKTQLKLTTTLLSVLVLAANASAQENQAGGYKVELEEIVVTAQQREETSMTTPVTVNAFTAQDIVNTGALSIQDMGDFLPGVDIGEGSTTQTGITIRGISSPNISSGGDPSAATFYDGAYVPRAATTVPFSDLARVEVLKGPQGTLFGRNATSGVINIVPNAPSQENESYIKARVGNLGLQRLEGMVNVPVSDNLAVRANVLSSQRNGIVNNVGVGPDPGEEGVSSGRLSALWMPSDRTSLQFTVDIEDRDEAPRAAIGVGPYALNQTTNPFNDTEHDVVGAEETRDMQGYSIKLNHQLNDQWSVFATTSFRDWETTNLQEEDGTPDPRRYFDTNNIEDSDIWYNEVRFNFVNDKVDLIIGGNYSKEDLFQRTDIHLTADAYMQFLTGIAGLGSSFDDHIWDLTGGFLPILAGQADQVIPFYLGLSSATGVGFLPPTFRDQLITESMENTGEFTNLGLFADVTYQLTDQVRLAAGLRYSKDDKQYTWQTFDKGVAWPVPLATLTYDPSVIDNNQANDFDLYKRDESWDKLTGRAVIDWQFSDSAMTFFSVATGYKSGGFDGQSFVSVITDPFEPEEATNYEWGLKGDFLNNRLRLEGAVFRMELDNRQSAESTKDGPNDPTASPSVISSDQEIDGIELIATWSPTDTLRLQALSTYRKTDTIKETFFNANGELVGGVPEKSRADSDYTLRFDWTPEISRGHLLVHVDYVFDENTGPTESTAIFLRGPFYFQDKKRLNARLAWKNSEDNLEFALWGKNLLDEEHASNPGGFVAATLGAAHTEIDDPLTWGIDMRWSF